MSSVGSLDLFIKFIEENKFLLFINNFRTLMIINIVVDIIKVIFISQLTAAVYGNKMKPRQYILGSLIYEAAYRIPFLLAVNNLPSNIVNLFVVPPPYLVIILYFIIAYIFKTQRDKCIIYVFIFYYFFLMDIMIYKMLELLCFYFITNNLKYQYIIYLTAVILSATIMISICGVIRRNILKISLWIDNNFQPTFIDIKKKLLLYTFYATCLSGFMYIYLSTAKKSTSFLAVFVSMCCIFLLSLPFLSIGIYSGRCRVNQINIENINLHINSLFESIENFRMVKHDINNMLQVYDGYISLEDYEGLKNYHANVYSTTRGVATNLNIHKKMSENPALYSVILFKINQAIEHGIYINVSFSSDASNICMEPIDISRIMGVLLDNAIEETRNTPKKVIHVSIEATKKNSILVSISNQTLQNIQFESIIEQGVTTKEGHEGLGLYKLWKIVSKTQRANISMKCKNNLVTFYLELPCDNTTMQSLRA